MKLFHTSDWHLGRMLYGRSLLEDQRYFLEHIFLPAVERERPACVMLAGDLYDRQVPPPEAIRLLDSTLARLAELGCRVCAISGNHDGAERVAILKNLLRQGGVYLATALEDAFSPVLVEENGEKAQLFLLPYFDGAQAREFLGDDTLRGEAACMEQLLVRMLPLFQPDAAHILVSHCFAAGAAVSDSESGLFVGGSGQVPPALFDPFDYAALGHLHGPQRAGEKGWYSGSPLKYSIDEAGQKKGFIRVTLTNGGAEAELVEFAPLHDVRRISGSFHDLLNQGEAAPCQDYVELVLEEKEPVVLAAERLRPGYPNLLAVSNPWAAQAVTGRRAAQLKDSGEETIFSSFLKEICQTTADEEDLSLFREILKEIRL